MTSNHLGDPFQQQQQQQQPKQLKDWFLHSLDNELKDATVRLLYSPPSSPCSSSPSTSPKRFYGVVFESPGLLSNNNNNNVATVARQRWGAKDVHLQVGRMCWILKGM